MKTAARRVFAFKSTLLRNFLLSVAFALFFLLCLYVLINSPA